MTSEVKTHLDNVQRQYGAFVFWADGKADVVHRCGGAEVHPGTFLLWPICGQGDVPAGEGFKSFVQGVTCPKCIEALAGEMGEWKN